MFRQFAATIVCLSFSLPISAEGPTKVSVVTPYLVDGIAKIHRVSIVGIVDAEGGNGGVRLDPNTCQLNAFGDATVCTLIADRGQRVKFVPVEAKDLTERGRRLFEIVGNEPFDKRLGDVTLFLVVRSKEDDPYRLVVKTGEAVTRVVNLEPIQAPAAAE